MEIAPAVKLSHGGLVPPFLQALALGISLCGTDLMDLLNFSIQLLNSVQYGLLLFMLAAGLTLIFGIMGVVNLAHGSFYMLGAFLAWSL
jgi:ABC-type branched-subunit amino acid transport system permease subunit